MVELTGFERTQIMVSGLCQDCGVGVEQVIPRRACFSWDPRGNSHLVAAPRAVWQLLSSEVAFHHRSGLHVTPIGGHSGCMSDTVEGRAAHQGAVLQQKRKRLPCSSKPPARLFSTVLGRGAEAAAESGARRPGGGTRGADQRGKEPARAKKRKKIWYFYFYLLLYCKRKVPGKETCDWTNFVPCNSYLFYFTSVVQ